MAKPKTSTPPFPYKVCSVEQCDRRAVSLHLCTMHYNRLRAHGTTDEAALHRHKLPPQCQVEGCETLPWARGYCSNHYQRWRIYGDANHPLHKAPNGSCYIRPDGYQMWPRKGKATREHRIMMESYLGRPLTSDEIVHHRDGNKLNNAIENLEIVSRAHHARLHAIKPFANSYARTCSICKQIKPRSEFGSASQFAINHGCDPNHAHCRECARRAEMYRRLFC